MLLAVDVGNTQTVLGLFEGEGSPTASGSRPTGAAPATSSASRSAALFELEDVDGICLSSTVPALQREWERVAERWAHAPLLDRRAGRQDGDPDPVRRSARGRARPDRERGRGERALRAPVHRRRLRHLDQLRHRLARGRVRRRRARAGDRGLDGRALRPRGAARQGRLRRAADRDRQDDGRPGSSPASSTGSPARWTASSGGSAASSASRRRRSPRAGSPS